MSGTATITDELAKSLAAMPEALDAYKRTMSATVEDLKRAHETDKKAFEASISAAEKAAKAADDRARAAEAAAESIRGRVTSASFSLPGAEEEVKRGKIRLGHFIAARAIEDHAGRETSERMFPMVHDVHRETVKRLTPEAQARTQVTHSDKLGGYLVPEEVSGTVVDFAYANTCLAKLNFTRITNARGAPYKVRKLTGTGTAYMSGESPGAAASKSTIQFGRVNLMPKKIVALGAVSKELDQLANPSAIDELERSFQQTVALKMEQQVAEGSGGDFNVRGLSLYTAAADGANVVDLTGTLNGVLAAAANGRDLTDYIMKHLRNVVEAANGLSAGGRMQHLMQTRLKQILALQQFAEFTGQKADTGSRPAHGLGIATDAQLEALYGTIAHSTQFASNLTIGASTDGARLFGGEFRHAFIVEWGGIEVAKTDTGVISNAAGAVELNGFTDEAMLMKVVLGFDMAHVRASDLVIATGLRTVRSGV